MRHVRTDSFQAHKDVMQFLSRARAMRSALMKRLYYTVCVQCLWVYCLHSPSIFWNSFQETEITTISRMMCNTMSSNNSKAQNSDFVPAEVFFRHVADYLPINCAPKQNTEQRNTCNFASCMFDQTESSGFTVVHIPFRNGSNF